MKKSAIATAALLTTVWLTPAAQASAIPTETLVQALLGTAGGSAQVEKIQQIAVLAQAVSTGNIKTVVEDKVKERLNQEITKRVEPYEAQFQVIQQLLGNTSLKPQTAVNNNSLLTPPGSYSKTLDMVATAYAPGSLDNGKWGNLNYMGGLVTHGVVAVDPAVIPMGTRLWVQGYGEALAADQGSAIKGNRIDLAFDDRQTALDYGIQNIKVYVLN